MRTAVRTNSNTTMVSRGANTIIFILFVAVQVAAAWKECATYVDEIVKCYSNAVECIQWRRIQTCSDSVVERMSRSDCLDKTAQKIVKNYAVIINITANRFCNYTNIKHRLTFNILSPAIREMNTYWVALTPGFLSSKGCKYFSSFLLSSVHLVPLGSCAPFSTIFDYFEEIYATSTCLIPLRRNIEGAAHLRTVYSRFGNCTTLFKNSSRCDRKYRCNEGDYYNCVKSTTINLGRDSKIRSVIKSLLDVAEVTDDAVCFHGNISKAIEANDECMFKIYQVNKFLTVQLNGFFTLEGCEGLKYLGLGWMNELTQSTCPIIEEYWNLVKNQLSCLDTGIEWWEKKSEVKSECLKNVNDSKEQRNISKKPNVTSTVDEV